MVFLMKIIGYFFIICFLSINVGYSADKTDNNKNESLLNDKSNNDDDVDSDEYDDKDVILSNYNLPSLPSTSAKQLILQDFYSGAILLEKNSDELTSPSSMTKIATSCLVFNKVKSGELSLEKELTVSKNAYRKEGSSMFLNLGQKVTVDNLIKGLVIQSGNDAAVTLAEGIYVDEQTFASELTSYVKSIGAVNTNFVNANGLPDPNHKTTVRDLLIITRHAILTFPEFYDLYSHKEFTFNGIKQFNKNVLLNSDIGCDGVKTGNTKDGGYGIVASVNQDGRRLILVVNGYKSENERAIDAKALLSWGMKMFQNYPIYKANEIVAKIPVWYGEESYLPITVETDLFVTLPRSSKDLKVMVSYDTPISAPVNKGDKVGEIQITSNSFKDQVTVPLVAAVSVNEAGFFKKIYDSFLYLIWGMRKPEVYN